MGLPIIPDWMQAASQDAPRRLPRDKEVGVRVTDGRDVLRVMQDIVDCVRAGEAIGSDWDLVTLVEHELELIRDAYEDDAFDRRIESMGEDA